MPRTEAHFRRLFALIRAYLDGLDAGALVHRFSVPFEGDANQVDAGTWAVSGVADLEPGTYIIRVTVEDQDGAPGFGARRLPTASFYPAAPGLATGT